MGIERLNSAARAAGFAMATSEETFEDLKGVAKGVDAQWRPGEAILVREAPAQRADWIKALLALFGRRAPVSPA
jgi:hypothetical protein